MSSITKKCSTVFSLAILLIMPFQSYSQSPEDPVRINWGTYNGFAVFEYEIKGKDTVLNGKFKFEGPIIDEFTLDDKEYFSFQGNFANNKPTGFWEFNLSHIKGFKKPTLKDHHLEIKTDELKHKISGSFEKDNENANWKHEIYFHTTDQKTDTIFTSIVQDVEKQEYKLISFDGIESEFRGQITKKHIADNSWIWISKKDSATLNWDFEKGFLKKVYNQDNIWIIDDSARIEEASNVITMELSQKYLEILKIKLDLAGYDFEKSQGVAMLSKFDSLENIRKGFLKTLKEEYTSPLNFSLPFYSLSNVEKNRLNNIQNHRKSMDSIFVSIDNLENMTLFKEGFPEVIPYLDSLESIRKKDFTIISRISELYDMDLLPYLNRNKLTAFYLDKLNYSSSNTEDSLPKLETLENLAKGSLDQLIALEKEIMNLNDKRQKQQKLLKLEEAMLEKKETFELALDSSRINLPESYFNSLNSMESFLDDMIKQFWDKHSVLEKLILAEKNLTCIDNLFGLLQTYTYLDSEKNKITELYTESAYNIYTVTDIDYLAKKKIVTAYYDLIPYFQKLINNSLSCENVDKIDLLINKTNERMYKMRNENTREIESKINSKSSPEEVLKSFGITLEVE